MKIARNKYTSLYDLKKFFILAACFRINFNAFNAKVTVYDEKARMKIPTVITLTYFVKVVPAEIIKILTITIPNVIIHIIIFTQYVCIPKRIKSSTFL